VLQALPRNFPIILDSRRTLSTLSAVAGIGSIQRPPGTKATSHLERHLNASSLSPLQATTEPLSSVTRQRPSSTEHRASVNGSALVRPIRACAAAVRARACHGASNDGADRPSQPRPGARPKSARLPSGPRSLPGDRKYAHWTARGDASQRSLRQSHCRPGRVNQLVGRSREIRSGRQCSRVPERLRETRRRRVRRNAAATP